MEAEIPARFINQHVLKDIVILVVGQTGAGKSTQIDAMLNYILDIKWGEAVRFKVIDEQQTVSAESLQAGHRCIVGARNVRLCPCSQTY